MRIFHAKGFARKESELSDEVLSQAVEEISQGLFDAKLGGGLIKKRVAGKAKGKSGGYRTLIAFHSGDRAFFLYCFAKN